MQVEIMGEAVEETGRVKIAGAVGVDHVDARHRVDDMHLLAAQDHRALFRTGQRRDIDVMAHMLQRLVEVGDLVERFDLGLVGEQDVDVVFGQMLEFVAVAVDAEAVRSEEHTSELQSLMRISYAVFCLKKKNNTQSV